MARFALLARVIALLAPLAARAELVQYEASFEIVSPVLESSFPAVTATGVTERVQQPASVQLPDFQPAWPKNHPVSSIDELAFPFDLGGFVIGFAQIDFTVGHLTLIGGTAALADPLLPVRGIAVYGGSGPPTVSMTRNGGMTGVGLGGGELSASNGAQRFSLQGFPWTLHGVSVTHRTHNGPVQTFFSVGFVHGPLSATSTALATGGILRVVTPIQMRTSSGEPFDPATTLDAGFFGRLEVRVVPEPGLALPLLLGCVLLLLLARRRVAGRRLRSSP